MSIEGSRYFRLAERTFAYEGVMQLKAKTLAESKSDGTTSVPQRQVQQQTDRKVVGSTQAELGIALPGLFEFAKAKG